MVVGVVDKFGNQLIRVTGKVTISTDGKFSQSPGEPYQDIDPNTGVAVFDTCNGSKVEQRQITRTKQIQVWTRHLAVGMTRGMPDFTPYFLRHHHRRLTGPRPSLTFQEGTNHGNGRRHTIQPQSLGLP